MTSKGDTTAVVCTAAANGATCFLTLPALAIKLGHQTSTKQRNKELNGLKYATQPQRAVLTNPLQCTAHLQVPCRHRGTNGYSTRRKTTWTGFTQERWMPHAGTKAVSQARETAPRLHWLGAAGTGPSVRVVLQRTINGANTSATHWLHLDQACKNDSFIDSQEMEI